MHPGRYFLLLALLTSGALLADRPMKVELRQLIREDAGTFTPPKIILDQPKDIPGDTLELERMVVRGKYIPPPPPIRETIAEKIFRTGTFWENDRTRLWTGPGPRGLAELKISLKF